MAAVTLTTLRARAREKADMVNSSFITDAANSLDAWINEGAQALHEKLVDAYDDEYLETTSSFTTAANAETYPLPADFFKLLDIELRMSGKYVSLKKYQRREANAYRQVTVNGADLPRYRLAGANVRLLPVPANGLTGRITYAPTLALLVNGADTVNFPNGWEKYVVAYAAKVALEKEESDTTTLARQLMQWDGELAGLKLNRDAAVPNQVVDVEADDFDPLMGY